jgi:hypothetical protein
MLIGDLRVRVIAIFRNLTAQKLRNRFNKTHPTSPNRLAGLDQGKKKCTGVSKISVERPNYLLIPPTHPWET